MENILLGYQTIDGHAKEDLCTSIALKNLAKAVTVFLSLYGNKECNDVMQKENTYALHTH
jgi:hypothetical protein